MSGLISTAASEYYRRPEDERYETPQALVEFSRTRKASSREVSYNAKDLRAVPVADEKIGRIALASPKGQAELTPWSHSQLCRLVGAPAGYLRSLPAEIAADAINHGLQTTAVGTTAQVLAHVTAPGQVTARAITSDTYGRLWDADYYAPVVDTLCAQGWTLPPTWDGKPAGAYASDRDSFLVLVNGGSIVTDPSAGSQGQLFRGFMLRNSEVGANAVYLDEVLYQFICGNHNFWGAVLGLSYRRRHVGVNVLRDVLRELGTLARRVVNRPASADEALIRQLIALEVATTKEAVIDELRKMGATQGDAETAYTTCEREFNASPRSYWGIAQGLTKSSQASGYQDERLTLDALAAKLLAKGRQRVAA